MMMSRPCSPILPDRMDSAKSILRVTKLIHWVLLLPPVMFGALVYLLIQSGSIPTDSTSQELTYIPLVLMIVAIISGRFLYTKIMATYTGKTLQQKLQLYMKATIVRDALFEMVGLVTCLVAYATGNSAIILLIVIIALQFSTNIPSAAKLEREGVLSREEIDQLA